MEVEFETEDFFVFLDILRDSGQMNMFGAPRELQNEFGLSKADARAVFTKWTETFKG
mgnify:CR=1 FL=1